MKKSHKKVSTFRDVEKICVIPPPRPLRILKQMVRWIKRLKALFTPPFPGSPVE